MHNPAYLMLSRHNIYYFRWPFPATANTAGKPQHLKMSLRTREPREALHLARVLEYHASLIFRKYGPGIMNNEAIKAATKEYLQGVLEKRKQDIRKNGPFDAGRIKDYERAIDDAAFWLETVKDGDGDTLNDDDNMAEVIASLNLGINKGSEAYRKVQENYYRALPALYGEILRFSREQETFDFSPARQETGEGDRKAAPSHALDGIIQMFIAANLADEAWEFNTEKERRAHLALLQDILGAQFNIADMDAEKARYVRDIINALPKNRNKNPKTRGKPLMEQVKVTGVNTLGPATIEKYLTCYSNLFGWCVNEGYISRNYFEKLKGRGNSKKDGVKRIAFTPDQIETMLAELRKGKSGLANRDYRYWGSMIGLYTGARLNEIAQIMLDDIKQEDGIWYFDMNDDGDNKKLKTEASRRYVPIHNALLDLGIIAYRDKLKRQGKARLLHELTYCKKNGYGKKLGHFFNQVFLPKLGMKKPEIVFHCFRHTAITRLLQAGEELPVVQSIVGHERSGTAMQIYFREGYKLPRLKQAMDKLHSEKA